MIVVLILMMVLMALPAMAQDEVKIHGDGNRVIYYIYY